MGATGLTRVGVTVIYSFYGTRSRADRPLHLLNLELKGYHLIRGRCKMAANIVQQVEKLEVNSEEKQTLKAKSGLYEVSKPYHHEWLRVSDLHEIYYEEAGNKDGKPILFV